MSLTDPVLLLMSLAVLGVLLFPLFAGGSRDRRVARGPSELDALLRRKAMLYGNMKDLEFEYRMGKLAEADYTRLRDEDRAEAARILSEIDTLEDRDDADAIIEREIAARESGRPTQWRGEAATAATRATAAAAPSHAASPHAGPAPTARASAAPHAGAPATPAAAVNFCPSCGARVGPGDRFCAQCGHALPAGSAS